MCGIYCRRRGWGEQAGHSLPWHTALEADTASETLEKASSDFELTQFGDSLSQVCLLEKAPNWGWPHLLLFFRLQFSPVAGMQPLVKNGVCISVFLSSRWKVS